MMKRRLSNGSMKIFTQNIDVPERAEASNKLVFRPFGIFALFRWDSFLDDHAF